MELMNICMCGSELHVNAGDSIQNGTYRWYASCHCEKCGSITEIDGCTIDSIPDDIKLIIIKNEGEWGIESSASKAKIKYLLNKIFQDKNIDFPEGYFFTGTKNQVNWVKNTLIERGMVEHEIMLRKLE
jgi:hypothetical protein